MAKVRIYELAKELEVQPNELLKMLQSIGVTGKVPSSSIEETAARSLEQMISNKNNPEAAQEEAPAPPPLAAPTFQKFRPEEFRARHTETAKPTEEVASDHIEDFREVTELAEGVVVQGPAKCGPGARKNIPAGPVARTAAPAAPARPATPPPSRPAAPSGNGASAPAGTGAATGATNGATPPPASPSNPTYGGNRGGYRGGGRGGRGGRGRRDFRAGGRGNRFEDFANDGPQKPAPGTVMTVTPDITIAELAELMSEPPATLIKKLFLMNMVRSANQAAEPDVAGQLLAQFGYGIEVETSAPGTRHRRRTRGADMVTVPPVVTVMGHVDHGKTSLARHHSLGQRAKRRSRRHHAAHRRLRDRAQRRTHRVSRYARPRSLHPYESARRARHRHRDSGGRCR